MSQIYNTGNIRVLNQTAPYLGNTGTNYSDYKKRGFEKIAKIFNDTRRTAQYLESLEIISPNDFNDFYAVILGRILRYCVIYKELTIEATAYWIAKYVIDSDSTSVFRKIGNILDYWSKAVFVEKSGNAPASVYRFLTYSYDPQTKKYTVTIEPKAILFLRGTVLPKILRDFLKRKWTKGNTPTPTSFTDPELGEEFLKFNVLGYDDDPILHSDYISPTYANRPMARFLAKILDYCLTNGTMEIEVKDFQTLATKVLGMNYVGGSNYKTIKNYLDFWAKVYFENLFIAGDESLLKVEYLPDKIKIAVPLYTFGLYRVCGFYLPMFEDGLIDRIKMSIDSCEKARKIIPQILKNYQSNKLYAYLKVSKDRLTRMFSDPVRLKLNLKNELYRRVKFK